MSRIHEYSLVGHYPALDSPNEATAGDGQQRATPERQIVRGFGFTATPRSDHIAVAKSPSRHDRFCWRNRLFSTSIRQKGAGGFTFFRTSQHCAAGRKLKHNQ